jgi:hypothetical protein
VKQNVVEILWGFAVMAMLVGTSMGIVWFFTENENFAWYAWFAIIAWCVWGYGLTIRMYHHLELVSGRHLNENNHHNEGGP